MTHTSLKQRGVADTDLAAWKGLLTAHARVTRRIEGDLAAAGLPPLGWYDVLWSLHEAPNRRLRMRDLADAVLLTRTGMTRLVDRIEQAGLLRRAPVAGDRRGAYAVLTDEGVDMLRSMWPVYADGINRYFASALEPGTARRLALALESVASAAS